jgi:hypothetical protein
MQEKTRKTDMPKQGRFLLSRRTFRTNVMIYSLTWTSLALILCAVVLKGEAAAEMWWVVLVTFFNTIAVGLSHRELLRLTIEQESEMLAAGRKLMLEAQSQQKNRPSVSQTESLFEGSGSKAKREDLVPH